MKKELIDEENFYHHFQPIYNLNDFTKLGFEGLLRSEAYPNPEYMFNEARKEKQLFELDSRSAHKAILTYRSTKKTKSDEKLFLNIYPSTILIPIFPTILKQIITGEQRTYEQIVLEISESEVIDDFKELKKGISELRELGCLFAVDDVGKGYANFQTIIELEPEYLKLDRYFAQNLYQSKQKQTLIELFVHYSEQSNSKIILEGVENVEEIETAKSLGIQYAQGFGLGRPALLSSFI